jgi:hypothetical protein
VGHRGEVLRRGGGASRLSATFFDLSNLENDGNRRNRRRASPGRPVGGWLGAAGGSAGRRATRSGISAG